jgi:hypothetical protein
MPLPLEIALIIGAMFPAFLSLGMLIFWLIAITRDSTGE